MKPNLLFICSRNEWRSRTAETIFKQDARFNVKSAGTAAKARVKVSEKQLLWSDYVFVMERHHKEILYQRFSGALATKEIFVLDIPDEYQYLDAELIEELREVVGAFYESGQLQVDQSE